MSGSPSSSVMRRVALAALLAVGLVACESSVEPARSPAPESPALESAAPQAESWASPARAAAAITRYQPWGDGSRGVLGRNVPHGLRFAASSDGMRVQPDGDENALLIRLRGLGRDAIRPVALDAPSIGGCAAPLVVDLEGECLRRVERAGPGITAWWQNDPSGLRQGWTLHEAPAGAGPVTLHVELSGLPLVSQQGEAARFAGASRQVSYSGISAWDATGAELAASLGFEPSGDALLAVLTVDDAGAQWPITIDPVVGTASWQVEGSANAQLGWSVSTAGDLNGDGYADVVVGAPLFDATASDVGRVKVFYGTARAARTRTSTRTPTASTAAPSAARPRMAPTPTAPRTMPR